MQPFLIYPNTENTGVRTQGTEFSTMVTFSLKATVQLNKITVLHTSTHENNVLKQKGLSGQQRCTVLPQLYKIHERENTLGRRVSFPCLFRQTPDAFFTMTPVWTGRESSRVICLNSAVSRTWAQEFSSHRKRYWQAKAWKSLEILSRRND